MFMIEAVIKPHKLDAVKAALAAIGILGVTAVVVKGFGRQAGHTERYRGAKMDVGFVPKVLLKICVKSDESDKAVALTLFGKTVSPLELGGWAIGLVGLFNIAGSLLWAWLGSRHKRKDMLALLYLLRSLVFIAFLALPLSALSVLAFAAALGFLWLGTVPLTSGLVGYVFGPVYMSTLYGIVFFSHQLGSFLGGWGAGRLYDVRGNYDAMWWLSIGLGLFAAAIHWPIRERPVERLRAQPAE